MNIKNLFFLIILITITSNLIYAQNTGIVTGKIIDSVLKKPLSLATVTVYNLNDSSLLIYRLSNFDGTYKIPNLPLHTPLKMIVSFTGYTIYRKAFTLLNSDSTTHFNNIILSPSIRELDDILVVAERPPVLVKKDTIEFNASAFKTLPNALVEDLLKKLPGIEVERNGDIYANGKKVNRIVVDGKSFFGDDPRMASQNLPANIIDKVQVADDKDELAENNDFNLSKVGKVINLTLKKGIKKGWFGKLYGGGGSKSRYEAGGIANIYRDTLQMSLLAFSNNINRSGFSLKDINELGGFKRSGVQGATIKNSNGSQGIAVNGISFGGLNDGLNRIIGSGVNINHSPNKKVSLFVQYFFGNVENELLKSTHQDQYNLDTIVSISTFDSSRAINNSHNLSAGLNWKFDPQTNIKFRVGYLSEIENRNTNTAINTENNKVGLLNSAFEHFNNKGNKKNYYHNFSITKRFKGERKKTLSIIHNLKFSDIPYVLITNSVNEFTNDTTILFNQMQKYKLPNTQLSIDVSYNQELTKKLLLNIRSRYEHKAWMEETDVYNMDAASEKFDIFNIALSNQIKSKQNRWLNNLGVSYKLGQVNISTGINLLTQNVKNNFKYSSENKTEILNDGLFNIGLNWKSLDINFSQDVMFPNVTYLNPTADSSNPFYITYGNPNLEPQKQNSLNINGYFYDAKKNINYNFYGELSQTKRGIIQSISINQDGVQKTYPLNAVDDLWDGFISSRVAKKVKLSKNFTFSGYLGFSGSLNKSPIIYNNIESNSNNYRLTPRIGFSGNNNDIIEFTLDYNLSWNNTKYSNNNFTDIQFIRHQIDNELIIRCSKHFIWENNIEYNYNNNLPAGFTKNQFLWNSALNFIFLKDEKGQIKFSVYDILNRNRNITQYSLNNMFYSSNTNVLNRFFLLTFTYNFRNIGANKKVGGTEKLFLF